MKRNDASAEPFFRSRSELASIGSNEMHRCKSRHLSCRFSITVALVCMITAISITGCGDDSGIAKRPDKDADQATAELVAETITIEPQPWPTIVRCQGTLYADEDSAIGARVAGRVATVHIDLGDSVKAGEPLVTLETEEFELLVAQVEAQLNQARSAVGLIGDEVDASLDPENSPPVRQERAVWNETKASLERAKSLKTQGAISQGEYDIIASAERVAEARYAAAVNSVREKLSMIAVKRVELALARQRLADAVIHAPFDGRVLKRHIAPGGYISAGDAVATLVRTDPIWFRGTLPERYASRLETGLKIAIRITSASEPLIAEVTRISPSLDMASRSLSFEAMIENRDLQIRAGLFASAEVVLDPHAKSLIIPESAMTDFAGAEKVWKLVDGVAQQLEISTGVRRDGYVEIVQGLSQGDKILMDASVGRVARVTPLNEQKEIAGGQSSDDLRSEVAGEKIENLAGVGLP